MEAQVHAHTKDSGTLHQDQDTRVRDDGTWYGCQREGGGGTLYLCERLYCRQHQQVHLADNRTAVRGEGLKGDYRRAERIQRFGRIGLRP